MQQLNQLVYTKEESKAEQSPAPAVVPQKKPEEQKAQPEAKAVEDKAVEEKTVMLRGRKCCKKDIEDMLSKHLTREPREPDESDCCNSGCRICVFDRYCLNIERFENTKFEYESLLLEFEN